jgi:predicted Fe-S protein YdhL (DUF1289 family)
MSESSNNFVEDVWAKPTPKPKDPCNRQCGVSSQTGLCRGCFRTLNEVADWYGMDEGKQREVLEKVEQRKKNGPERDWNLVDKKHFYEN